MKTTVQSPMKENSSTIAFLLLLAFIIIIAICVSCSKYAEDALYITRKYCGNFDTLIVGKRYTEIYTTQDNFLILKGINLNIPKGSPCYVKYIRERLSGTKFNDIWILYFTWEGTSDLYMIKQNYITGRIIR